MLRSTLGERFGPFDSPSLVRKICIVTELLVPRLEGRDIARPGSEVRSLPGGQQCCQYRGYRVMVSPGPLSHITVRDIGGLACAMWAGRNHCSGPSRSGRSCTRRSPRGTGRSCRHCGRAAGAQPSRSTCSVALSITGPHCCPPVSLLPRCLSKHPPPPPLLVSTTHSGHTVTSSSQQPHFSIAGKPVKLHNLYIFAAGHNK